MFLIPCCSLMSMKKTNLCILAFLVLSMFSFAEFKLTNIEVILDNLQKDGSVTVKETVTFRIIGDSERNLYENALNRNELSFWYNVTGISDIGFHLDTSKIRIDNLIISPQPINDNKCSPFQKTCYGEIRIQYLASSKMDKEGKKIKDSGVFYVEQYKPRTTRYVLNGDVFLFTKTDKGQTIIDKTKTLRIKLPEGSLIQKESDLRPSASGFEDIKFPKNLEEIIWTNTPPTKLTLVFEIEDTLYNEVSDFFKGLLQTTQKIIYGNEGPAIIIIFIVLLGGYLYLNKAKAGK